MACPFAAAFVVVYVAPNLWVIAVFYIVSRIGVGLWLFNLYNYRPSPIRPASALLPSPGPMGSAISAPGAG